MRKKPKLLVPYVLKIFK